MTTSPQLFATNGVYSFETRSPAILGSRLEKVRCEAELSYDACIALGYNVGASYRSNYPALPQGTPDTPRLLRYYLFTTQAGGKVVICEQWVDRNTITLVSHVDFDISFTRVAPEDVGRITAMLRSAGYTTFTVREKTS